MVEPDEISIFFNFRWNILYNDIILYNNILEFARCYSNRSVFFREIVRRRILLNKNSIKRVKGYEIGSMSIYCQQ